MTQPATPAVAANGTLRRDFAVQLLKSAVLRSNQDLTASRFWQRPHQAIRVPKLPNSSSRWQSLFAGAAVLIPAGTVGRNNSN